MKSNVLFFTQNITKIFILLLIFTFLSACVSEEKTQNADDGEIVIGLTDAPGDFVSYTVDVSSLTLTKANGSVVHALPVSTRVDFAQYTDMTEFLTAATIPSGVYVKANMNLDYSNADIWVEGQDGNAVEIETIVDTENNPITDLDLSVRLEGRNVLLIKPGIPKHLTLDFDLNASNKVEFDNNGIPTQVVEPFLLADVELKKPKIHRLRGPLLTIDQQNSQFELAIRPFNLRPINDRMLGKLNVKTNADTVFDINNENYIGAAGIAVMADLPRLSATVVLGDLKFNPIRFIARAVYAGDSVPGGDKDVVRGTVISRVDNTLTIKGATLIRAGGSVVFNDRVTVSMTNTTQVKKQFDSNEHSIDEISVGQRVSVFGALTPNIDGNLHLDASEGTVRMIMTVLRGHSIATLAIPEIEPPLHMELQSINNRKIDVFDFAGTGIETNSDADPLNYQVSVSGLNIPFFVDQTPLKVGGFVTAFHSAPMDFDARTVVDVSQHMAVMVINWEPATSTPFIASSANELVANLSSNGRFHHLSQAGISIDLNDLISLVSIQPSVDNDSLYIIIEGQSRTVHTSQESFMQDMDQRLMDGSLTKRLIVTGKYDNASNLLSVQKLSIKLM